MCWYCQKSSPFGLTHDECKRPYGLDGFQYLWHYTGIVKKIISSMKYGEIPSVFDEALTARGAESLYPMVQFARRNPEFVFQPIPLHREKMRDRGFNQSEYIVEVLQKWIPYPIVQSLSRVVSNPPQAGITNKMERLQNTRNIFRYKHRHGVYENVIIVDDVVTTGSTVREAVRSIKQHGLAQSVMVWALAHG